MTNNRCRRRRHIPPFLRLLALLALPQRAAVREIENGVEFPANLSIGPRIDRTVAVVSVVCVESFARLRRIAHVANIARRRKLQTAASKGPGNYHGGLYESASKRLLKTIYTA
jgi:hypothetical protein